MKSTELRDKNIQELENEISSLLKSYFGLRMQKATQQLSNHAQLKTARRSIARAKTIWIEKKRAAS